MSVSSVMRPEGYLDRFAVTGLLMKITIRQFQACPFAVSMIVEKIRVRYEKYHIAEENSLFERKIHWFFKPLKIGEESFICNDYESLLLLFFM